MIGNCERVGALSDGFTPTSNLSDREKMLEDEAERLREIERIDVMVCNEAAIQKQMRCHNIRSVKQARGSRVKHKKPHMNKKVMSR